MLSEQSALRNPYTQPQRFMSFQPKCNIALQVSWEMNQSALFIWDGIDIDPQVKK